MIKLIGALVLALFIPMYAHAAWWNPFSWSTKQTVIIIAATSTPSTTVETINNVSSGPSAGELNKRIAELESKLEEAYLKIKLLTSKDEKKEATTAVAVTAPVAKTGAGLSSSQLAPKAKAAVVLVQTATTSESGVIISSSGHVIVDAHSVWIMEDGKVIGIANEVSVTLSNGSKKKAALVGFDEANDVALYIIAEKGTYSFLKPAYDTNVKVGDSVYISSYPSSFIAGSVSKKASTYFELSTESKPADSGGAILNSAGEFIGIPNKSACKVLEEMKTCLKYSISSNTIRQVMPKLFEGMKLYKEKKVRTAEERLVRGYLDGIYGNTLDNSLIQYAISNVTGGNSFDYLSEKLSANDDVKMKKLYLNKLKGGADYIHKAVDFLKNQAYNFNIALINDSVAIEKLEPYQRKILAQIQTFNSSKLKEYQSKVDYWTAKKNEYDKHLVDPMGARVDYLLEQGIFLEKSTEYLVSERRKILDTFSGENVNIF